MREFNEKLHPRAPKGDENGGEFVNKITKKELEKILKDAQIAYNVHVANSGSAYWTIDGVAYRVSDHTKPEGEFNYYTLGENDFRNYNDFYDSLSKDLNLKNKTEEERVFKENNKSKIIKNISSEFVTPTGSRFNSIENALSAMWSETLVKEKAKTSEMIFKEKNKSKIKKNISSEFVTPYGIRFNSLDDALSYMWKNYLRENKNINF